MKRQRVRGFTLFELLLVLAVIVALAALAAPTLTGTLHGYRLRKTGDLIRAEWARTRNDAMETGEIHVFQYELNGRGYGSQPWVAGQSAQTTARAVGDDDIGAGGNSSQYAEQLPDDIVFALGETAADSRVEEDTGFASAATTTATPIVFYPDGTTSTARLVLKNDRDALIAVELRGLTGISRATDLFGEGEQ